MSEEKKEVLLELRGIKTFFPVRSGFFNKVTDYVQAVNNVDLDIYRGETLGLVGESAVARLRWASPLFSWSTPRMVQ